MHELGITQNIVAIVTERAGNLKVNRVKLEIGKLSAIVPDAIRFCFDLCAKDTLLDGAILEIVEIDGLGKCESCGAAVPLSVLAGLCNCGSRDIICIAGKELKIKEMEVA
ncbi:MAG TPA: hydrogenase maturation nickel metallochaperone HypA [Drouetiella sp.]|jgi:hydrogenase nickel incorporation protein HypA/HybF